MWVADGGGPSAGAGSIACSGASSCSALTSERLADLKDLHHAVSGNVFWKKFFGVGVPFWADDSVGMPFFLMMYHVHLP